MGGPTDFSPGRTAAAVVLLACNLAWTRRQKKRFLAELRREHPRARERLRMREEIETARRVQLSMLPQSPPAVEWLELAGRRCRPPRSGATTTTTSPSG